MHFGHNIRITRWFRFIRIRETLPLHFSFCSREPELTENGTGDILLPFAEDEFLVFSSLTFLLLFLPALLLLYFLSENIRWRNGVLVAFSLLFYAWGEPVMVLLLIGTTLFQYLAAIRISRAKESAAKKFWLALALLVSLGALIYFKYSGFLVDSLAKLFRIETAFSGPVLPIGISFYTFQILTYTIDVYYGRVPEQKNPFRLLLYVSCFPQLIAGPIVKYADIAEALDGRTVSKRDFAFGIRRFLVGLSKKVLLANICGKALSACMEGTGISVLGAWFTALLYALQLYFDFSAYSDMAIGLGRVLGFSYRENFRYPYISLGASEFWRRWHISLGSFFREYVYIPLGGNRKGKVRTVLNLLIVWILTGLWHGAAWNFALWGLYWFVLLLVDKMLQSVWERFPKPVLWVGTFLLTLIGWVLFYHTDLLAAGMHLGAMFGIHASGLADKTVLSVLKQYALYLPAAVLCCLPIVPTVKKLLKKHPVLLAASEPAFAVCAVLLGVVSLLFLIGQSYNPFIYFRF